MTTSRRSTSGAKKNNGDKAAVSEAAPAVAEGRRLVLDTAARLFKDEGFAATSLRDIAAECGMKPASLYYHFASKDEIVSEVLRIGVEQVFAAVQDAVAALPADADARTLLGAAVRAHLQALWGLQDYTSANVRIFGQVPPAVREAHIATRDRYEHYWAALLERCAASSGFDAARSLRLARLFLLPALNGSLEWFRGSQSALNKVADELSGLLLYGLLAREQGEPAGKAGRRRAAVAKPATKAAAKAVAKRRAGGR